ncbi:DUF3606 domain-containing protein [Rhizobium binxianense]
MRQAKPNEHDPRLIARGNQYKLSYFMDKHGLSLEDAARIIKLHGADLDAADKAARRLMR